MIIDGRAIAAEIKAEVAKQVADLPTAPVLTVFTNVPNFETQKFLTLKQRQAAEVGIKVRVVEFSAEATVPEMVLSIQTTHRTSSGIIIQLPFPAHIDIEAVLPAVLPTHDVDVLTYDGATTAVLPPVAGAVAAICERYKVNLDGAQVLIVGQGRLVGVPVGIYMRTQGADVTVLTKDSGEDLATLAQAADIIVTGAGVPGLITPEMISAGAIVFDAGTSEDNGELAGDVDPKVAEKCRIFTPVPGGIGPIAIAILLKNLVNLTKVQLEKT